MAGRSRSRLTYGVAAAAVLAVIVLAALAFLFREGIQRTALDPKQPFQTYRPPPAPDYAQASAWALIPADPAHPGAGDPPVDVFFVHTTDYDGGHDWNSPIGDKGAQRFLTRVDLPNYAGPFARVGRVFAPQYRQASVYAHMTLRDDAREARRFPYGDVRAAFAAFLQRIPADRPIVLAGAGQGATLLSRLLHDVVEKDPTVAKRVVAAYLVDSVTPADLFPPDGPLPPCRSRAQSGCVVAWAAAPGDDQMRADRRVQRALVWTRDGRLDNLLGRKPLCVNPLTGAQDTAASAHANLGAANATGLEWGVRPGFLAHQVGARCVAGLLRTTRPVSSSLQRSGSWADRHKSPPFNLFYADIEADAEARVEQRLGQKMYGPPAPPIQTSVEVKSAPVHRIE